MRSTPTSASARLPAPRRRRSDAPVSDGTRDWDARTYDRVSGPQQDWAREVIERLPLGGDETVLDAGCGSGRVGEQLLARLPRGRLIAVDGSAQMAAAARERLGDRATVLQADLLELELGEHVDVVFSTAVFHWIADHDALFRRLAVLLRPGGQLEAQCGGQGNVSRFRAALREVSARDRFRPHLEGFHPTHFASPGVTEELLRGAGFEEVRCWLEPRPVRPDEPEEFVRAVCLGAQLERLPQELREDFLAAVLARLGPDPELDYVRLNISARRAEGA